VAAATAILDFVNRASIHSLSAANVEEVVLPIGFALVGGLIASRLPRNVLGWLFLFIALASAIPGLAQQYVRYGVYTNPAAPLVPWAAWLGNWLVGLVYPAGAAPLALLLVPDGRFMSARWRAVAWIGIADTAVGLVVSLFDPGPIQYEGLPPIPTPLGVPAMAGLWQGPVGYVTFLVGLAVILIAAASVVVRLRRTTGEMRLQLKWVAYATAFAVAANVSVVLSGILNPAWQQTWLTDVATIVGFGIALPVSFGFAILRYRLYELDLIVNRTVVYGVVTAILAIGFGVANIGLQRLVEALTHQHSDLIAGGLGALAALAFAPLRRLVRPVVDRFLPSRAVLTLLFTDIVGSTQAIVELGDVRWRALLARFRAAVRQELGRFGGHEVNTAGDAFFATLNRPAAGIQCARAIRAAVEKLGLETRTGIHLGECEMRGEEVSGLAVHTAARVMAEAGDGEILISDALRAAITGTPVELLDRGRHELKGVPGEWQLYSVTSA
jgi:class 3 adenylate cyclase